MWRGIALIRKEIPMQIYSNNISQNTTFGAKRIAQLRTVKDKVVSVYQLKPTDKKDRALAETFCELLTDTPAELPAIKQNIYGAESPMKGFK